MSKRPAEAKPPANSAAAKKWKRESEHEARQRRDAEYLIRLSVEIEKNENGQKAGSMAEPVGARGGDWVGICHPAHVWGVSMLKIVRSVKQTSMGEHWKTYEPEWRHTGEREAYFNGYKAWFRTGRAEEESHDQQKVLLKQMRAFTQNPARGNLRSSDAQFRQVKGEALTQQVDRAFNSWMRRRTIEQAKLRAEKKAARAAAAASAPTAAAESAATPSPSQTPPTQRAAPAEAAAAAAADDMKLLVSSTPWARVERYDAMSDFLSAPEAWHTFDAGTTLMLKVEAAMQQNRMFAVAPAPPAATLPAAAAAAASASAGSGVTFRLLDTVCEANPDAPDAAAFFGNLLVNHDFRNLLRSDCARENPRDESRRLRNFGKLGLEYVGHGGYNSVWKPNGTVNYGELPFPRAVVDALENDTVVLRAVIPRDDRTEWMTLRAARGEMTNMATAAQHGYGPHILAMGWQRAMGTGKYTGDPVPMYRLYAFLQRGTMDVDARMTQLAQLTEQLTEPPRLQKELSSLNYVHGYFDQLLAVIWGYSSDRCVFVDAKLKNFIDTFPRDANEMVTRGAPGVVRVIDLADDGFRRLWTEPFLADGSNTDARTKAQGWRPIWLHNVLVISCAVRLNLPYDAYRLFWWDKIHNAVRNVHDELRLGLHAHTDDFEYQTAAKFVDACKWHGPLRTGRWNPAIGKYQALGVAPSESGNDPVDVAAECKKYATFYFVDVWHQYGWGNYIAPVRHELSVRRSTDAPPDRRRQALIARDEASTKFDSYYRLKVIPMHRHFRHHRSRYAEHSKTLVEVMYLYCAMSETELRDRYVSGAWGNLMEKKWPPVMSYGQQPEPAFHQANNLSYWDARIGF